MSSVRALQRWVWSSVMVACFFTTELRGQPTTDEVYWASESSDGLLVGLRLAPNNGCVHIDQPLQVQFLLKNITDKVKSVACVPTTHLLFDVREDNLLFERGQTRQTEASRLTLAPGETLVPSDFQLSISTQQLLPGVYTIPELIGVWGKEERQGGVRDTNLGTVRKVSFTISDPQQDIEQSPPLPAESDAIVWGEPLMGISVGAKLVQTETDGSIIDKSQRFHLNETLLLQLFLFNQRDTDVTLEVEPARVGDLWEVAVFNGERKRKLLRQLSRGSLQPRPVAFISMSAGEQVAITGVPLDLVSARTADRLELDSGSLAHAGVELVSIGDRRLQNPYPLLEAEFGNYFATATVHIKLHRSDFSAAVSSGDVPFRIVKDILQQQLLPLDDRAQ